MPSSNVLIVFYSRCGSTEKLAATAAVGAVQARAAIRLRRVPDANSHAGADGDPDDCQDAMLRMRREYVAPAERDVVWADAIVFAAPDKGGARSGDWKSCLTLLGRLRDQGNLDGKLAVVLNPAPQSENRSRASISLSASILDLGFIVLPPSPERPEDRGDSPIHRALIQGRRVAAVARDLRAGSSTWKDAANLLSEDHDIPL